MTHSYGKRSGTRYKFARPHRGHGMPALGTYLKTFRRGDYVTIKINGAIQKGLTTGFYHGRTGRVFDVTKNSVGVEISKRVRWRILSKRIHVRREHVIKSAACEEFLQRRARNDALARASANKPEKPNYKRDLSCAKPAALVSGEIVEFAPVPFSVSF